MVGILCHNLLLLEFKGGEILKGKISAYCLLCLLHMEIYHLVNQMSLLLKRLIPLLLNIHLTLLFLYSLIRLNKKSYLNNKKKQMLISQQPMFNLLLKMLLMFPRFSELKPHVGSVSSSRLSLFPNIFQHLHDYGLF